MLATHRKWTKKSLKQELADHKAAGEPLPAGDILLETSMFGPEIKPGVVTACLDHPKRSCFANITLDADLNIVGVK
jgi:hypothetical protein